MDKAEEFLEEYDDIFDTMQTLYENAKDKDLKQELFELISVLMEDYGDKRNDCEAFLQKQYQDEMDYMNYQYENDRL